MAQQRYVGPDGTIYEDAPGGGYVIVQQGQTAGPITVGTPDPSAATKRLMDEARLAAMAREAARAPVQQSLDTIAIQRAQLALQADQRKQAQAQDGAGKPLRQGDGDKIESEVGTYAALKGALGSFTDDYAGNTLTGGLENTAQRRFGTGTPGQADWWANFAATDNQIRNKLFGASLTDGEKQAYNATTITPSMKPDLIRQNLARRAEIVRSALSRKISRFKAGGFNPAEIDAALGEFAPDFQPGYKAPKQDTSANTVTRFAVDPSGAPDQMSIATGATRTENDPALAGVNAKINAMMRKGEPDDRILSYMREAGVDPSKTSVNAALQFRKQNPQYKGGYAVDVDNRQVPMTGARQAFQAVGSGPAGSFFTGAADALTAGRLDNIAGALGGNAEQVNAAKALLAKANPTASLLGTVTGGALASTGIEAGLGLTGLRTATGALGRAANSPLAADVGYGALMGSDEGGVQGAAVGGVLGGVGGRLGQGVARAAGGVRNEAVQALRDRGVQLTLGQAVGQSGRLGAVVKGLEDRLSGLPVVGAMLNDRRREGFRGFNRAAMDEALAPIGGTTAGAIGEAGVDTAQDVIGQAYDNALGGVRVRADGPFVQDMVQAMWQARALPEPMAGRADYTLRTRVGNSFDPNRELTGRGYQQSVRGLRRDASAVAPEPYGYDFGGVTRQAEDALQGMLERQAPGTVDAVRRANEAFRLTEVVRDAVNRGRNGPRTGETGLFAPSQLADAAAQNARRFGNTAGTTRQPFYELSRAGQDVLPNAVPDSGTTGRAMVAATLAGGGAGAGYLGGDTETGLAVGGALAALQTQAAQRALVAAVLDRPELLRRGSDWLVRNGVGGAVGAPLALQALPSR